VAVTRREQEARGARYGECRRCRAFCDKLVDPRGCIAQGCEYLYSYVDELSGRRFMGCMNKVFRAEIDIDMFELAEMTGGFGGIKMTGRPLPQCQFTVERCYEGRGSAYDCVNLRPPQRPHLSGRPASRRSLRRAASSSP
jgi:hypothetical protein